MVDDNRFATLVLIRHGQARAEDGSYGPETPLSMLGRRQASAVAQLVKATPPAAVYTSPFPRAMQTSEPLVETVGLKPVVDQRLAEFELGTVSLDPRKYEMERPDP